MNETKSVTPQASKSIRSGLTTDSPIRPPVDIFEDESGITLRADMPGVARDGLDLSIDGDTLAIEGEAAIPVEEGMQPLHAEVRSTRYERSFSLSRELDTAHIDASLKNGVLTLRIPKREEHKPRKIELRTD